jgi:hypothetical protein
VTVPVAAVLLTVAVSVKFAPAAGAVAGPVSVVVVAVRVDAAVIVRLSGLEVLVSSFVSPP